MCPWPSPNTWTSTWRGFSTNFSRYMRSSPKDDLASERTPRSAETTSSAVSTKRIPLPPPPADALNMTGKPIRSAAATTSSSSPSTSVPGTTGTPASCMIARAVTLSPIFSIASGCGPMNVTPAARHAAANGARSDRKP